ncbi:YjcZ family sporulation protein [Bacillus sp. TE8-1]|nr:YjcZ family sporulation protein [Bacillus sp. TE8-1]
MGSNSFFILTVILFILLIIIGKSYIVDPIDPGFSEKNK